MICTRSAAKTEDRDKRRHGLATYDSKHYIVHCYIQDEAGSNPTGQSAAGGRMTATVHKTRRTSIIEKKVEKVEGVAILNSKGFSIGLGLMKNLKSFFLHKDKRISSCPRPPAPRTDSTQKLHPLETTPLQASFVVDDHQQRTSEAGIHSAARIYCRLPRSCSTLSLLFLVQSLDPNQRPASQATASPQNYSVRSALPHRTEPPTGPLEPFCRALRSCWQPLDRLRPLSTETSACAASLLSF